MSSSREPPYPIPGPAGSMPTISPPASASRPRTPAHRRLSSPRNLSRFCTREWAAGLSSLRCPLLSSVALLRARALSRDTSRTPALLVRLDSFTHVGRDVLATLSDPTGELVTSLHAAVLDEYRAELRVGAVVVLEDVRAVELRSRTSNGFRNDPGASVHLTLSKSGNIARVYDSRASEEGEGEVRPNVIAARAPPLKPPALLEAYALSARSPKSAVRPRKRPAPSPIRQPQFSSRQPHQQPLQQRQRNGPPAARNTPRPPPRQAMPAANRPPAPPPPSRKPPHPQVADLSDDALDDLLGDIDIDAAIAAASGRGANQETLVPPPSAQNKPPGANVGADMDDLLGDLDVDAAIAASGRGSGDSALAASGRGSGDSALAASGRGSGDSALAASGRGSGDAAIAASGRGSGDTATAASGRESALQEPPVPPRSESGKKVAPIAEDDVDDLLGDMDIDAAIFASGRLPTQIPAPVPKSPHGEEEPRQSSRTDEASPPLPLVPGTPACLPKSPDEASPPALPLVPGTPACLPKSQSPPQSPVIAVEQSGSETVAVIALSPSLPEKSPKVIPPSAVNDSVIDDLMDGLDADDFDDF